MSERRSPHYDPLADTPTTTETCMFFTGDGKPTSSTTFKRRKNVSLTVEREERQIQSTTVPVFNVRDPKVDYTCAEFQFSDDPPDGRPRVNIKIEPQIAHRGTTTKFHPTPSVSTIVGSADGFESFSTTIANLGELY
ncbi:hypothetical protein ELS19_17605 [Halogeometricum borinquense]|uniref:Uncharacterized protein n=1 Tax=Halogeometricum borinquense TaxID=60847 RepID=A0A482T656_9EURY|nr:hypothetical protein [Halogeometricum borinquense]RYJ08367.1 hypothetical protein ELS19_17605 [Halogeometricum borinquense]